MTDPDTSRKLARIARAGQVAVILALVLAIVVLVVVTGLSLADPAKSTAAVLEELSVSTADPDLAGWQHFATGLLWSLTDLLGIAILFTALDLFNRLRRRAVFEIDTVARLRRIGWLLVVLAPVSILANTLIVLTVTITNPPGTRQLSVGIEDADVYAVVVGLVVVATALAMTEALRLARENESFV